MTDVGLQNEARQDHETFRRLREAIRRREVRLKFKGEPIAHLVQALYWAPKTGTVILIMLALPLYLLLCFALAILFAVMAHLIPLLAPVVDFFFSRNSIAALAIGVFVLVYWVWRRRVALSSVEAWTLLWRAGVLRVAKKDEALSCASPEGDWRAFARTL
ncbi:MAG: hypothetical protein FJX55_06910 [Alphaproteobacteria bacterium]|nr:hypothetical protein [Alphaproteobacteria bacterium]